MKMRLLAGFVATLFAAVSLDEVSAQPTHLTGSSYTNLSAEALARATFHDVTPPAAKKSKRRL